MLTDGLKNWTDTNNIVYTICFSRTYRTTTIYYILHVYAVNVRTNTTNIPWCCESRKEDTSLATGSRITNTTFLSSRLNARASWPRFLKCKGRSFSEMQPLVEETNVEEALLLLLLLALFSRRRAMSASLAHSSIDDFFVQICCRVKQNVDEVFGQWSHIISRQDK